MKSTKPFYNRFKHHMATLVSTAVLACVVALPSASMAATRLPDSSYSKMCFELTELIYVWVQIKDKTQAVARHDSVMGAAEADTAFKTSVEELFYFGLAKRNIYRGENLKSLLMLHCPDTFRSNSN